MIRKKDKPAETEQKIEISIPISESSWEKLKVKATLKNTNPQELASELVSKGLRRRSGRDPDKLVAMVQIQQSRNETMRSLKPAQRSLKKKLKKEMKEELKLWER